MPARNKNIDKFIEENQDKYLCACGCGNVIKISRYHYHCGIPRYINGHKGKVIVSEEQKRIFRENCVGKTGEENPVWKNVITKEELIELYVNKNLTPAEIAKIKNVSRGTISYRLEIFNISRKLRFKIIEDKSLKTAKTRREKIDKFIEENQGKYLCQCGCGNTIIIDRHHHNVEIPKFIPGHHMNIKWKTRGEIINKWIKENQGKYLCTCECGQFIEIKKYQYKKGIPRFISGHNSRTGDSLSFKLPTSLERKFIDVIRKYNLSWEYTGNGKFILDGKCPDFINTNGLKICIEVRPKKMCKIWSKCTPEEYVSQRVNHFAKYGWQCLVIWQEDMDNPEIINFLKE